VIAQAAAGDAEAVVALWQAAGLTRPWNDPLADFRLALRTTDSTVFVAHDDGTITGSVMVGFDGHRGWVYYLAVSPDRRGQGIGKALMAAAEAWLRECGASKLQLMVRRDNVAAIGFYESLGLEKQDVVVLGKRF
jgi:ribosomal protein S18 acetylase RimI-like enzyme